MEVWEELAEAYEEGFNAKREVFGKDVCNLEKPVLTDGGAIGDSIAFSVVAEDIPCFYKALGHRADVVIGGTAYMQTHEITMPRTDETSVVTPEYKITVQARNGKSEKVFERPVIKEGSFSPLAVFTVSEVIQGYQV